MEMRNGHMATCVGMLFCLAMSCSKDIGYHDGIQGDAADTKALGVADEYAEAKYDYATNSWIYPCPDAYSLDNFRRAYEALSSGCSVLTENPSFESVVFNTRMELEPTHYALKITPNDIQEERRLEQMTDIVVSHIPFGYELVPQDVVAKYMNATSALLASTPSVVYEVTCEDSGGGAEEVSDLYVTWPVEKEIADTLSYELVDELYIPRRYRNETDERFSVEQQLMLEAEALYQLTGEYDAGLLEVDNGSRGRQGYLCAYDDVLGKYVPVPNAKIDVGRGGGILSDVTDENGHFGFSITYPIKNSIKYTLQSDEWTVAHDGTSTPVTVNMGTVKELWGSNSNYVQTINLESTQSLAIHRAANYFFNGDHELSEWYVKDAPSITIHSMSESSALYYGLFTYDRTTSREIKIYPNTTDGRVVGTTLHELGHFAHYCEKGSYNFYDDSTAFDTFLKETSATFLGWYLGVKYYTALGASLDSSVDYTGQARQSWEYTKTSRYSPLFVDLFDDYNQYGLRDYSLLDPITEGYTMDVIRSIMESCRDIASVKEKLMDCLNVFELRSYLVYYETWCKNNC